MPNQMLTRIPDRMLESNKESNALARARNGRKCHSYGVEYNTTVRIDRSDGWQRRRLDCESKGLWRLLESLTVPASRTKYVRGYMRYNQINGGSANGDAFVDWHSTTRLSLQVAGTAVFILLRVDHVQCHVTPPHYTIVFFIFLLLAILVAFFFFSSF
jgi:hypothetical protein